jgi:hypothetical protein
MHEGHCACSVLWSQLQQQTDPLSVCGACSLGVGRSGSSGQSTKCGNVPELACTVVNCSAHVYLRLFVALTGHEYLIALDTFATPHATWCIGALMRLLVACHGSAWKWGCLLQNKRCHAASAAVATTHRMPLDGVRW